MAMTPEHLFLVFSFLNLLVGVLLNLFIIIETYKTGIKRRSTNPRDLILFTMGLSNTAILSLIIYSTVIFYVWRDTYMSSSYYTSIYSLIYFTCLLTTWMASWLCIFFCVTIVSFPCSICTTLKSRFPSIVPQLIVVSVMVSLVVIPLISIYMSPTQNTSNDTLTDSSNHIPFTLPDWLLFIMNALCFLPYSLIFVSLNVTVTSLVLHFCRIRVSANFTSSKIHAHVSAAITMMSLLALQTIFCLGLIVQVQNIFLMFSPGHWVFIVMNHSFSTIQAIILIIGNARLREPFISLWIRFTEALLGREAPLRTGEQDSNIH